MNHAKNGTHGGANFDANYQPINDAYPGMTPTDYTVRAGDTLRAIATKVWGDGSMWFLIADANGLAGGEKLTEGSRLTIPNRVTNLHNNASTFKVYNAGDAIGDVNPTLPAAPPPPQQSGGGCGGLGSIIMIVVAIAAAFVIGPYALQAVQFLAPSLSAGLTTIAAGALTGAAASVVSQGVGIAIGAQKEFSWSQVAMGAIGGGVTAGVTGFIPGIDKAIGQGLLSTYVKDQLMRQVVGSTISNVITQGVSVATGMQGHIDWSAVAATAVGSGVTQGVAGKFGTSYGNTPLGGIAAQTVNGFAGGVARAMAMGGSMNYASIATDAFGNALGDAVGGRIRETQEQEASNKTMFSLTPGGSSLGAPGMGGASGVTFGAGNGQGLRFGGLQSTEFEQLGGNGALGADELALLKGDVERQVQREILGQEAREDSLRGAQMLQTGGAMRTTPRGIGSGGFEMVRNGNWDAALNIGADPFGVLPDLAGLKQDMGKMGRMQAESRINDMRQRMTEAGMKNVPTDYRQAWVEGGAMVPDYGSTVNDLQNRYEGFVRDNRLQATYGDDYQSMRLGKSQMTVLEFEKRVLDVQQQATDKAYTEGVDAIARRDLKVREGDYARTLGSFIDLQVRTELRGLARTEGLNDSMTSNIWGVNRSIRSDLAEGRGIPDNRLGYNLFADTTLAPKSGYTEQIMKWNAIRPDANYLIIRPTNMPGGGSYVIPRAAIQPYSPVRSTGRGL